MIRLFTRLILTLLFGIVVFYAGYRMGQRSVPGAAPVERGTSAELSKEGSKIASEAKEESGTIGRKLARAGSEASGFLSDAALTTKVKSKMGLDDTLDSSDIHVSTSAGVVTLSGTVPTKAAHQRAVQLARETKGVKAVTDRVEVK